MNTRFLLPLVAVLLGTSAFAQLSVGDTLPTGDVVTDILWLQTGDDGDWFAWVDSDFGDVTQDGFLLRNGQVILREGSALAEPPGSTLDDVVAFSRGVNDDLAELFVVDVLGLPVDGLYFGGRSIVLVGDLAGAPEVPAATTWERLDALWLNPERTLLLSGEIANPDVIGVREDALARFQLDASGGVSARNVLLTEGQLVPVLGAPITALGSSPNSFALNGHGDFVGTVFIAGNSAGILENLDTVLARKGAPAPIPGRTYRAFEQSKVAVNDFEETAFSVLLDGLNDSYCIIENGQKFVQEGDTLPALPQPVGDDGDSLAPIFLANSGDLFWRVWDQNHQNDAFMRNYEVIVLRNVTVIDGHQVVGVARNANAFHVSRDGRFFLGRVVLQASVPGGVDFEALVGVDFGLVVPRPGCAGNAAHLGKASGDARAGQQLTFELDGAQALGAMPVLLFTTRAAIPGSDCGRPIPGGELLVDPSSRLATLFGPPWTGTPVSFGVNIPANLALVDFELFAQGLFVDPSGVPPRLRLSNGLRLEIGAP